MSKYYASMRFPLKPPGNRNHTIFSTECVLSYVNDLKSQGYDVFIEEQNDDEIVVKIIFNCEITE